MVLFLVWIWKEITTFIKLTPLCSVGINPQRSLPYCPCWHHDENQSGKLLWDWTDCFEHEGIMIMLLLHSCGVVIWHLETIPLMYVHGCSRSSVKGHCGCFPYALALNTDTYFTVSQGDVGTASSVEFPYTFWNQSHESVQKCTQSSPS